jgi:hypothetical protein
MSNIWCRRLPAAAVGVVAFACAVASPIAAQRAQARDNPFDGNWRIFNSSETCMVKRAPWHMTVRNGAVAGGGDHPANGSISATGVARWTRPAMVDGRPVSYSGTFRGNVGSGTYVATDHGCSGSFTARRE